MPVKPKTQLKYVASKPRACVKAHGGKWYLARRIIELFPDEPVHTLCEPCAYGASVSFNTHPRLYRHLILGDVNPDIINLHAVLRDDYDRFHRAVAGLTYAEPTFRCWRDATADEMDDLSRAVRFFVTNRMSRGGLGGDFAWSDRLRGGQPGDVNGWDNAVAGLQRASQTLQNASIRQKDVSRMLALYGHNHDWLWYIDPPYLPDVRTAKKAYGPYEMTPEQHREMLDLAKQVAGKVIISMYRHRMYDEALEGWRRVEWDMPNHSSQTRTKERRTECVWLNY